MGFRSIVKKSKLLISLVLIIVIGSLVAVLLLRGNKNLTDRQQMEQIRSAVSKHIILPVGEDPTLATVTDKNNLKDEFLKKNAATGDKVLVYYKALKVFIYRPEVDKLVATGPLTIDASANEVAGTKIRVRNGSNSDAAVNRIQGILTANYTSATIQDSDASVRKNYPSTIVIDLTDGTKYNFVTNIAKAIGAARGVLPAGEVAPDDTDILIITGVE